MLVRRAAFDDDDAASTSRTRKYSVLRLPRDCSQSSLGAAEKSKDARVVNNTMRVLERSHGLRRSVSGTLRPREAPQKPRRRPYVLAAALLVVFGAVTHLYIDYEAVHTGEVPTDAPKEEKAKEKKKDREPVNVVVRVLSRNKGAAEDVARRFRAASPKRVELWETSDSSEARKTRLKEEGLIIRLLSPQKTTTRYFLEMLSEDEEDAFLIDGDQFSLPGAVVSSKESIKAIKKTLTNEKGKLRFESGDGWWSQPIKMVALTNGGLKTHGGHQWLQSFRASLDELEGLVEGRSQSTMDLAGQLALREAWWRAPIELGRVLTASSFVLWEVPSPSKFEHDKPGSVQRALRDSRIASHQTSKRLLDAVERERKVSDKACPRQKPPAPKHGVVVVSGADARTPGDDAGWDAPLGLTSLPKGACKPAACDDVRAQLGGAKANWAKHWSYPFVFGVTSSLAPHLDALGLKNFEFAKPFLLIDALHGRARSLRDQPRKGHWLAWLDHDVWPHPETAFSDVGSLDVYLDAVDAKASIALGNFRSLNTGVLFARLDLQGRAILHEWALTSASGVVECQPYDQAALQLVLLARLQAKTIKTPLFTSPFDYTCTKALGCGGTPEKPFGMCNPHYHASVKTLLRARNRCGSPNCDQHFDRGRANDILGEAGFFTITEDVNRPRPQCFDSQRLDGCRTRPGANFDVVSREASKAWLFNHKGLDLFLRSRPRGANNDEGVCAGRAFRGGVGDTPKQKCTKSDQAAGKCRKVVRPLSEKRTKKKRRMKKPAG